MSFDSYNCGHKFESTDSKDRFFAAPCPECYIKLGPTTERSTADLIDRYRGYRSDPQSAQFNQLVDLLVSWMITHKIPPDEMRDAAFLASIKFVQMHPMDIIYRRDDL